LIGFLGLYVLFGVHLVIFINAVLKGASFLLVIVIVIRDDNKDIFFGIFTVFGSSFLLVCGSRLFIDVYLLLIGTVFIWVIL